MQFETFVHASVLALPRSTPRTPPDEGSLIIIRFASHKNKKACENKKEISTCSKHGLVSWKSSLSVSSTLHYCQRFCLSIQSRSKHLGEDKRRVSAQRLLRASSTGLRITVVKGVRQNKSKACATLVDKACNHPSGRQISNATPPTRVRFIPKLSHCNPCTDQETTQETNRKR